MGKFSGIAAGLLTLTFLTAAGTAGTLIELKDVREGELQAVGFELMEPAEVTIEALGLLAGYNERLAVSSWIIDHETREPVWVMRKARTSRHRRSAALRVVEKTKFLEKGKYELYFHAANLWNFSRHITIDGGKDLWYLLGDLFEYGDLDEEELEDHLEDCFVRLSSDDVSGDEIRRFDVTGDMPDALVLCNRMGDDEYIRRGFSLDKPMSIRIYSIIEHPRGYRAPVDYGWIVNADTREKVWQADRGNTSRTGGGRKNRKFDDEIQLEKGDYVLYFVTDDSHSHEEFNVNPPYDPFNWGITLLSGPDFDQSAFHLFEAEDRGKPLVDLTRARDDDYYEQAFELTKPATLYVCAVGEYSKGDRDFCDYGWIEEAGTGHIVWQMSRRNTQHAGGAEKNRMFDGGVKFDAGKYVAFYVTDGSHSYRDWNTGRPFDPRAWGLAVYPGAGFEKTNFRLLSDSEVREGSDVLVRMTRVRDRERRRAKFTLDKQTRVRIYAVGEGERGEMYDFGRIDNDETSRQVWEMTWRNTDHAGGARKNRVFDDTIVLDSGTYEVHYVTDGSHSFNDWNASRPRDAMNWGITVSVAD